VYAMQLVDRGKDGGPPASSYSHVCAKICAAGCHSHHTMKKCSRCLNMFQAHASDISCWMLQEVVSDVALLRDAGSHERSLVSVHDGVLPKW